MSQRRNENLQPAEWMLQLGAAARLLANRGWSPSEIAEQAGIGKDICLLALAFALTPTDIHLRALAEDWDLDQIAAGIATAAGRAAKEVAACAVQS
jgi:hypothetical protein